MSPPDFDLATGGYVWRPLRQAVPVQKGWDVYALQTGLEGSGEELPKWGPDGWFGDETTAAVRRFQQARGLLKDGIAGGATQRDIAGLVAENARTEYQLPHGIPFGHVEKESSAILGNHTPPYPDGERDCGPVQCNTNFFSPGIAFNTPKSIFACGERIRRYHDKYRVWGVADRRAYELACGSWNAPAWTDRLAKGETLPEPYRQKIEAYIDATTAYVRWTV